MKPIVRTISAIATTLFLVFGCGPLGHAEQGAQALSFQELMKFRAIENPVISDDGAWIAYTLKPDRGEYEVVVHPVAGEGDLRVERGAHPQLAKDSRWMACALMPTQKERDEAADKPEADGKKDDDGPHKGMALVSLTDGETTHFEEVESFAFSDDGHWIAWKRYTPEKNDDPSPDDEETEEVEESEAGSAENTSEETEDEERPLGTTLILRNLLTGQDLEIPHVSSYTFDEPSLFLAYAVAGPGGEANAVCVRLLPSEDLTELQLHHQIDGRYTQLEWAEDSSRLAFLAAVDDEDFEAGPASLWFWDGIRNHEARRLAASADAPESWRIPSTNTLTWSRDGKRLFFGYQWIDPVREKRRLQKKQENEEIRRCEQAAADGEETCEEDYDPYDLEALLDQRELHVWHGDDPLILPHQKKNWEEEKDRVYLAVVHLDSAKTVPLADLKVPVAEPANNQRAVLATSNLAYRKLQTWDGEYVDLYHVDLISGKRLLVAEALREPDAQLSPEGRYMVYYDDRHWHLFDSASGTTRNLTADLPISFANEDDDYPAPDPGYGIADWTENDGAVLIYDKYDLWKFPTTPGKAVNLTEGEGRSNRRQFRQVDLDPERDHLEADEVLLLHSFDELHKNHGFWQTRTNEAALSQLLESEHQYHFLAKAENADTILFTRESYTDFPDLWVAGTSLESPRRLSEANPQIPRFARGTAELVEWDSADGIPLQGVLIKPGNYEAGRRYPVLVYFYRFFSQRLHQFNEPVVNHRPNFPVYASHGYAVFLPDIRFEIGRPGLSAVKALVPGIQKLVDMGIANPEAIGLHGHSWSGYQTAYVITQTNIFAAAVAGAPVSNMTSAYSGIRLGSGMARQFQYEMSQSRIGGSLDAELPKYLENSPVFHARHIETPLLIQFGDRDEAVPWQQGIELYLAMRRLDKDVIFLQYRDEPHHLKKYPNKLDYSIKMKEFLDHHLKGEPAPQWMTDGVPYRGE